MTTALRIDATRDLSEQGQDMPWIKNYAEGVPTSLNVPHVPLYRLLDDSAAKWPDRPALRTPQVVYDYASLAALAGSTAARRLGCRRWVCARGTRLACSCPTARRAW